MKNNFVKVILIMTVIALLVLIGFLYFTSTGKTKITRRFNYTLSSNELYSETINSDIEKISIKSTTNEIIINKSEDDNFKISIYGDKKKDLIVLKDNGILDISMEQKKRVGFLFNSKIGKIELSVPENYEKNINIINDFGNIIVGQLKNAEVNIEEDAGNIEIEEVSSVKANIDFGNIKIGTIDKLVEINSDYGDVKIDNLYITDDSSIKNDFGSINIGNTNKIFIKTKTDLGNVKVNNNHDNSNITLTIINDCGDITVNN